MPGRRGCQSQSQFDGSPRLQICRALREPRDRYRRILGQRNSRFTRLLRHEVSRPASCRGGVTVLVLLAKALSPLLAIFKTERSLGDRHCILHALTAGCYPFDGGKSGLVSTKTRSGGSSFIARAVLARPMSSSCAVWSTFGESFNSIGVGRKFFLNYLGEILLTPLHDIRAAILRKFSEFVLCEGFQNRGF